MLRQSENYYTEKRVIKSKVNPKFVPNVQMISTTLEIQVTSTEKSQSRLSEDAVSSTDNVAKKASSFLYNIYR